MATERIRPREPAPGSAGEWLCLAEARRELDVMSEDVVRIWAEYGWLRNRRRADGQLEVLRTDVSRERRRREALEAIGGDELTPEELEELHRSRPGTLPWKRGGANASR